MATPGLRPRPQAREVRARRTRGGRRRPRRPRPLHLGRHAVNATRTTIATSTRRSTGSPRRQRQANFGGPARPRPPRQGGAPSRARLMPAIRGLIAAASARSAISTIPPPCSNSSTSNAPARAGGPRHILPRPFPAHQDPPAGRRSRSRFRRCRRLAGLEPRRGLPRRIRRLLRALQAPDRRCATPTRSSIWSPASAMITFARDKATARIAAEFYGTPSTSCAAPRPSTPMSACPSRRPSTSSTGCSRKPSSSACRSRRASPAASRSSPAAPAASAAPSPALSGRGRLRGARRHRPRGARRAVAELGAQPTARTMSAASLVDVTDEAPWRAASPSARRIRRRRHPRLQRRHLVVRADRGHHARDLEPEHRHPGQGLFPGLARGVPPDEAPEARRRDRLHRLEERPRRLAQRRRLLHRQGGRDPPRPLPGAGRRAGDGIRVNMVNPDAVLRGSKIWSANGASSAPPPTR